jgi:hypothetical protein
MDRRWSAAEVALHVGFGGRLVEQVGIDIDEGQMLALFLSEAMRAVGARGAAASATAKPSMPGPLPGRIGAATKLTPSNGWSPLSTLATNYFEPIQTPTIHNHCSENLVVRHRGFDG